MKIGLSRPFGDPGHPIADIDMAEVCVIAEECGFDWVSYGHHTIRPLDEPVKPPHFGVPLYQDPLIGAARALAMTTRIEVSTGVLIMPMQHPVVVAKQVATIDRYAGGRFALGLGTGGASRLEIELSGGSFEHRWAYTMECVEVMKGLWTQDSFTYSGEFFHFPPVLLGPRPATVPHTPIWLGGFSDKVLQRVGEQCQGWLPVYDNDKVFMTDQSGPEHLRVGRAKMHRYARSIGREVEHFEIAAILSNTSDPAVLPQYQEAGADRVAMSLPELHTADDARRVIEELAEKIQRLPNMRER